VKPARVAVIFAKSVIVALVLLAGLAALAAVLILGIRVFTGDELEPFSEMLAAAPGFLMKLASPFILSLGLIFYTLMKREKSNGT